MSATLLSPSAPASQAPRSRLDYEDFLYHEAALLDDWRLDDWYALFTEDAIYEVPTAGAPDDISSADALFYIADDYGRLGHRVGRLNKASAHSEYPRSDTTRIIGNVRVLGARDGDTEIACTFVIHRSREAAMHVFCGHMRYLIRKRADGLRIASKRVFLDMSSLRSQGRISIIL